MNSVKHDKRGKRGKCGKRGKHGKPDECAIFLKSMGFKDIKYDIPVYQM